MKKLMHTLLSITFIVIFLIAVSTITVCAKDYLYGNIVETGITSGGIGAGTFQAKFCDSEGNQACYEFAETVVVNGETYYNNNYSTTNNIYDLVEAIPYDVFARFSCIENKIYVLDFDATATAYNNITYNQTTGMFNIRGLDVRSLPVFYTYPTMYNDSFFKPYLDENHIYTIEVYDYAVKVVDYFALNYQNTLKNIYISQGVMQDYSLSLDISCVSTESSEKLSIEIYDNNSNSIYFETGKQTYSTNNKNILITNIANSDISCTIKIRLNDGSSPTYTIPFIIKKAPVFYGNVVETGITTGGISAGSFQARICDTDGNETIYSFADTVTVNGEPFYNNYYAAENNMYDLQQAIPVDAFTKFAVSDGKISVLDFDDFAETYYNVTYNTTTNSFNAYGIDTSSLPVFYKYPTLESSIFAKPYLDGNHIYTIELYDYAVKVVDYSALNYKNTLKNIITNQSISSDYSLSLVLSCESTEESAILSLEIYDEENNQMHFTISNNFFGEKYKKASITGLPNTSANYTLKLKLSDNSSPIYTIPFSVEKAPIFSGTVVETGITTGGIGAGSFQTKIRDIKGNENGYSLDETVTVNGVTYYNNTYSTENNVYDLQQLLSVGTSVEYGIIGTKIKVVNYGTPIYKLTISTSSPDKVTAYISIVNARKDLVAYIAIYKGKKLVSVTPAKFNLTDTTKNKSVKLNNIDSDDFDDARLFIWDTNLAPICIPIQANIIK